MIAVYDRFVTTRGKGTARPASWTIQPPASSAPATRGSTPARAMATPKSMDPTMNVSQEPATQPVRLEKSQLAQAASMKPAALCVAAG